MVRQGGACTALHPQRERLFQRLCSSHLPQCMSPGPTLGPGDRADGAGTGANVHDVGSLKVWHAEVGALAHGGIQHPRHTVEHDGPLATIDWKRAI